MVTGILLAGAGCKNHTQQATSSGAPNEAHAVASVSNAAPAELHVVLLDNDPNWIAVNKEKYLDVELLLSKYSPEWKRIQAEIDKAVSDIHDEQLRAEERKRVSERLLPHAKLSQLLTPINKELDERVMQYLASHKDDYRIVRRLGPPGTSVTFGNESEDGRRFESDGLFYDGDAGLSERNFLRLTARVADTALTKFRLLNAPEIGQQYVAELARIKSKYELVTSVDRNEGRKGTTPEQIRARDANDKKVAMQNAESIVWQKNIILAAQADVADPTYVGGLGSVYVLAVRKSSPIYLVERSSGAIIMGVARGAFCTEKDKMLGDWGAKLDSRCQTPRAQ